MALRGERFVLDLSDDEDAPTTSTSHTHGDFVKDIVERAPSAPKPPSAPTFKPTTTTTGFPEHKKRTRVSAFKQQRSNAPQSTPPSRNTLPATSPPSTTNPLPTPSTTLSEAEERRQIDQENKSRLAAMSPAEIERERAELLASLDPALVKMLLARGGKGDDKKREEVGVEEYLRRANMDDGRGDTGIDPVVAAPTGKDESKRDSKPTPKETDAAWKDDVEGNSKSTPTDKDADATPLPKPAGRYVEPTKAVHWIGADDDAPPSSLPPLQPASSFKPHKHTHSHSPDPSDSSDPTPLLQGIHFPPAPSGTSLPQLDPTSPTFLTSLHNTYFPTLPADPAKLSWMAPLPAPFSDSDLSSPYSPSQPSLPPSALRFDFRGQLLPPRIARAMPHDRGLHHHADAPEAAGYTISELSRLARSTVPAQRCMAFQVLGRVLYRLGKGEWGEREVGMGIWRCVEEGGVVEVLVDAAGEGREGDRGGGGHRSVKAYAMEAVWLWRKGGGKKVGAV